MTQTIAHITGIHNPTVRPILFSSPMVRAILEGRKKQTRRVAKLGADRLGDEFMTELRDGNLIETIKLCPYGQPGDRLWVRETFTIETNFNLDPCEPPFKDGRPVNWHEDEDWGRWWEQAHYAATDPSPDLVHEDDCKQCDDNGYCNKWKPSIHMPRWASRILLEITNVRIEKLQKVTVGDCLYEGIDNTEENLKAVEFRPSDRSMYIGLFRTLWDSINAARGFGWDKNPWVWVVEFKRINP